MKSVRLLSFLVASAATCCAGVAPTSPLFASRNRSHVADLDRTVPGYIYMGLKTTDGGIEYPNSATLAANFTVQAPAQSPVSASLSSICLGSACLTSWCLGSACGGSGCLGSVCTTSVCLGSGCATSYCGGSVCRTSVCGGSVCQGSVCGGSVCSSSVCGGTACTGSKCGKKTESFQLVRACDYRIEHSQAVLTVAVSSRCVLEGKGVRTELKDNALQAVPIAGSFRSITVRQSASAGLDITAVRADGTAATYSLKAVS